MGCWNGTCGITGLPIRSGDKIVAFPVGFYREPFEEEDGKFPASGFYNPTDMGSPMSLPIYGKYNDYGGIEDIEESYCIEVLKQEWGYDKIKSFNSSEELMDSFANIVERRLELYGRETTIHVGLWFMHRSVFEAFKNYEGGDWYRYRNKERKPYDDVLIHANEFFDEAKTLKSGDLFKYSGYYNTFIKILSGSFDAPIMTEGLKPYKEFLQRRIGEGATVNSPDIKQLIEDVAGLHCLMLSMSSLRKGFLPSPGLGSQDEEYPAYRLLINEMSKIIDGAEATE